MLAVVHAAASQITVAVQTPVAYTMDVNVDKQLQHKICTLLVGRHVVITCLRGTSG
jgi:hypothetical protein